LIGSRFHVKLRIISPHILFKSNKDAKIIILNYEDYDAIITKELQQFEKMDVSVEGCDTYLDKLRKVSQWNKQRSYNF